MSYLQRINARQQINADVEMKRSVDFILEVRAKYNIIEKIKNFLKPALKKLTVGLLATGIFFGAAGGAKAADLSKAEQAANNYAKDMQTILSQSTDIKVEAHAVRKGAIYQLRIKLIDPVSKDFTIIELVEAGSGSTKHIKLDLGVNKGDDNELDPTLENVSRTIYDIWAERKLKLNLND